MKKFVNLAAAVTFGWFFTVQISGDGPNKNSFYRSEGYISSEDCKLARAEFQKQADVRMVTNCYEEKKIISSGP